MAGFFINSTTGLSNTISFSKTDLYVLEHMSLINPSIVFIKGSNIVITSNVESETNPANTFITRARLSTLVGFPFTVKINSLMDFIRKIKEIEGNDGGNVIFKEQYVASLTPETVDGATQPFAYILDDNAKSSTKIKCAYPSQDELNNGPYSYFGLDSNGPITIEHCQPTKNYPMRNVTYWSENTNLDELYVDALQDIEFRCTSNESRQSRKLVRGLGSSPNGFRIYCDGKSLTDQDGFPSEAKSYITFESVTKQQSGSSVISSIMSAASNYTPPSAKFLINQPTYDPTDATLPANPLPPPIFSAGTPSAPIPASNAIYIIINKQLDNTIDNKYGDYNISIDATNKIMRWENINTGNAISQIESYMLFEGYPYDNITGRPVLEYTASTFVKNRPGWESWSEGGEWDKYLNDNVYGFEADYTDLGGRR